MVFVDNIGNVLLGDCIWGNHSVAYPSQKFMESFPNSNISAELGSFLNLSGLRYRNILPQSHFDNPTLNGTRMMGIFFFGPDNDIDDRYVLSFGFLKDSLGLQADASLLGIRLYNDSGATFDNLTNPSNSMITNSILRIDDNVVSAGSSGLSLINGAVLGEDNVSLTSIQWAGVADAKSCGLYAYRYYPELNGYRGHFRYFGELAGVNPNYNYYNQNIMTRSVGFLSRMVRSSPTVFANTEFSAMVGGHFIGNTAKQLLITGDAQYPIVCADGQTPTSQWATDMYVFDNNATLGFPAIGRVRNLLLATGSYTAGRPVRLQGSARPDSGFNRWLPVATFAGKTVLMRCYSSVNI